MAEKYDLSVILRVLDKASGPLKTIGTRFKALTKPVNEANKRMQVLGTTMKKVGDKMSSVGRSMSMKLTLPLTLMAGLATKTSIDFESAFTGIRKTVEATEEEFAILKTGLMGLAREIPLSTQEIFGIGEAAGQLGIQTKNIQAFTKVMADLGSTTNISADEAATQLARFANITQMSQDDFQKLGSVIVDLGNNFATTEAEIVAMGMRLAGAGKLIGMTEAQTMGLSAALTSVGINAEAGGTAFSQVMRKIDKDIGSGNEKMQGFAKVSGMSVKSFEQLWKVNAAEAVLKFTEGLGKMEKQGVNVNQVLDFLGMDGMRIADSLLRASGSGDLFRQAMVRGTKAWKENNALTKEANLRYATTASRLAIAKNKLMQMAAAFGDILARALIKVVEFLEPIIDWFTEMGPVGKTVIIVIGALVAAIGPLLIVLGFLSSALGAIMTFGVPAILALAAPFAGLLIPIAAVAAAIVGIGAAMIQVMRYWEDLKRELTLENLGNFFINKKTMVDEGGFERAKQLAAQRLSPGSAVAAVGAQKSETDINIKVTADAGTTATVRNVKSKGNVKPNIATVGYVGAS